MESLKNIQLAARALFFSTGILLLVFIFMLKNGISADFSKMIVFTFDLPFLFFGLVYLLTGLKLQEKQQHSLPESFITFFALIFFAFVVFFQFAYPDLI